MTNQEIAQLFRNVAAAYAIKDEKKYKFQIIAYQKAADATEHASVELKSLYRDQQLDKVPGIGKTIQGRLEELFETGHVKHFDDVMKDLSPAIYPLLDIPSFGPKKAYKLVTHFKLKDPKRVIAQVKELAEKGQIRELDSFGEKSEADILQAIEEYRTGTTKTGRMVLPIAFGIAQEILDYLNKSPDVLEAKTLGSLRRMVSTIGDVDIAVTSKHPEKVIEYFAAYPQKERLIEKGPFTASFLIGGGRHVDLLVLKPETFGSLLQHFTGSKHHNVALREYALKKGWSLSERGIKKGNRDGEMLQTFKTEEAFYKFLGMDWIPPEIRENTGEIEAARTGKLPKLVELKDIKGDLHIHSNHKWNSSHDYGKHSMEEMVKKAKKLGYEYIGLSDHNPSMGNQSPEYVYKEITKRNAIIEQIIESNKSIRVIKMLELDILVNGDLAISNEALEKLDAVIVSVHSSFSMPKEKMMKRILKGLSHPKAKILAHPTGRLINQRSGYDLDWKELFKFCAENNKAIEINAWPTRLDLPDGLVREAKDVGVKFVINTDSHALDHMDNMFYGVAVARRGWCEKENILNALPADKFIDWITS